MPPKRIFKKSKNFEFFQKRGVKGVKKWFFWKNISKIEKGFKNWVLNMCHMSPKRIFKKTQNFEFFQKRGVKGIKKWKFRKNTSETEKGFKNWILNMCHTPHTLLRHPPDPHFVKNLKRIQPQDYGFPPNYRSESHKQYTKWKLMHRPTTFKTFGPIKGSFWTPKLQKIKWHMIRWTTCSRKVLYI